MNTTTIVNTSQKLGRTIGSIRDALTAVPEHGEQVSALTALDRATNRIWRVWLEHCDNIDEAVDAVSWILGDGLEEVGDLRFYAESEFHALAAFEREVVHANRESLRGFGVDRDRLRSLFDVIDESDRMRQAAERRIIRAYGSLAFVADTW